MDEIDFTLNGQPYHLTRDGVIRAMRSQVPGRIQTYSVDVDGVEFPVKQVLAQALRIKNTEFISTRARDILSKLGFVVINVELEDHRDVVSDPADERFAALELAVTLHAGQTADIETVLGTADRFATWLQA